MIDGLVWSLALGTDLTAEEILDVLWLSAIGPPSLSAAPADTQASAAPDENELPADQSSVVRPDREDAAVPMRMGHKGRGGEAGGLVPATEVGFGSPRPIRDALATPRALRRFRQVRAQSQALTVDIDATVEATADNGGRLMIAFTHPLERALDIVLVVDGSPHMRIWDDAFEEFEGLLAQTGAFRSVAQLKLVVRDGEVVLLDPSGAWHSPRRLIDPAGRRVILVATDASTDSWYSPALWHTISSWCEAMTVALVQVLPQNYWDVTALGEPYIKTRALRPATSNSLYPRRLAWWASDPGGFALPVVTLAPEALETWAQAAVSGTAWTTGITATAPGPEYAPSVFAESDAQTLISDFLSRASPGAERLARVLALAPALSIPLISVLQERLLPETGVLELAEVLSSPMLDAQENSAGQPVFRFREGTAEILQRGVTTFEEWDSYTAISKYFEEHHRLGGPLRAVLADNQGSHTVDLSEDPFSEMQESLVVRLGLRSDRAEPGPVLAEPVLPEPMPPEPVLAEPELAEPMPPEPAPLEPAIGAPPETEFRQDSQGASAPGTDRPNYFIILDLDPAKPWVQAVFERSLVEHRSAWALRRNGIKTDPETILARKYLGYIRDIERVMRDPGLRRREQEAAREIQADDRRQQRDSLVDRLDLILAKGFLYDIEIPALTAEMDVVGADGALRGRLENVEVRSFNRARTDDERLDRTTENVIRTALNTLAESTLYAALARVDPGITETSPRERLLAAADELYRTGRQAADKSRPEVGAMQELAGLARRIFGDDDLTRRYNFSMLLAPLEELAERYERDLAPVRALDASQAERFLRAAAEQQIDLDLAKEFLISYFDERHWRVDFPSAAALQALKRLVPCPRCGTLNDPDTPFCEYCGHALKEQCPSCGLDVTVGTRICPTCSFPTGQRDWAEYLVEQAEYFLARQDLADTIESMLRAEQAWPTGAGSADDLAVRIRSVREKVTQLESARDQEASQIAELMQDDRYRAALSRLRGLSSPIPSAAEWMAECERKIAEARDLCRTAERSGISDDTKAELFLAALRICKDYEPARQGLESMPPESARNLRISVDEHQKVVTLAWEQNPSVGCTWVVVRAEGTEPPISAADMPGLRVIRGLSSPGWTDPDPLIGAPVRYAVYTQRGEVLSSRPAIAASPVLLVEAPQLTARSADSAVRLIWTLPRRALGVELRREEVGSNADAVQLEAEPAQGHLVDTNLRNGVRYRYLMRARYADPTTGQPGGMRYSLSGVAEATPLPTPAPPPAPYAQGGPPPEDMRAYDHRVVLRWPLPGRGRIKILRTGPRATLKVGDDLAEDQFARNGVILDGPPPSSDYLIGSQRFLQYFPALLVDDRCYVGHPRRYLVDPEVSDPTVEYVNNAIRVRWKWPELGAGALVAFDETAEIPDPLAGRAQARVSRNPGETTGHIDIPADAASKIFVLVAMLDQANAHEFVSSGIPITVQPPITLRYEQVRSTRGRRSGELVLRPERQAWLPALVVRGRTDNRPAGPNDPVVYEWPGGQTGREQVVKFPLGSAQPRSCRLFVANDSDGYVKIIHPR